MNKLQAGIPVGIGVTITVIILVVSLSSTQQEIPTSDLLDKEVIPDEKILPEIQEKLDEIKKKKLENEYSPEKREWITSGPFQIDRSEYLLGEKIFVKINELKYNEKGQIVFLRPLNNTHYSVYETISFDGAKKEESNFYFQPQLSELRGYCNAEDFIGDWRVVFRGTEYPNLEFEITNKILPGDEDDFISVC